MNNWFSFFIALAGIIIPFVSNILNNKHQSELNLQNNECQLKLNIQNNEQILKLKELEFLYSGKFENISTYLNDLMTYLDNPTEGNLYKYKISMAKACIFASKNVYSCIEDINNAILDGNIKDAKYQLYEFLLPEISKSSFIEKKK